jgi:predicted ATP-dependent serine protease
VSQIERRLSEAAKLGFSSAIYGGGAAPAPAGFRATTVRSLSEAVDMALGRAAQGSGRDDQP